MPSRYAIIMAGGRGERFWPLSRPERPKHLLPFFEGKTLMEQTLERLEGVVDLSRIRVVTSRPQEDLMRRTMAQLTPEQIVVEPQGRDTTAAVALATRLVQLEDPDATIAMLPADHFIGDVAAFKKTLLEAFELAEGGDRLVTIGITPSRPATGYGYLERGEKVSARASLVAAFKEKPILATAEEYLASGKYLWNSGIFVWRTRSIVAALEQFAPDIWGALAAVNPNVSGSLDEVYPSLRHISVDFCVMEKAANIYVVQGDFGWDDVGEWPALRRLGQTDAKHNAITGKAHLEDCHECLVVNDDPNHLVTVLGAQGLVVVHTPSTTLVVPASRSQELKRLLASLNASEALKKFTV